MNINPNNQNKKEIKEICICNKVYAIKEKVSSGGFGIVYKAFLDGEDYAIKEIKLNSAAKLKPLIIELDFVHKTTNNKSENEIFPIVKIFDYEWIEKEKALFYVMELGKQSLHDYFGLIARFNDLQRFNAIWIVYSYILKALIYFESISTAHRDIKPQNFIILEDNSNEWGFNIKLIDFGTIRILGKTQETPTTYAGTLSYMAPEVVNGITSIKSDIWSLGIMLFELINNGELPEHAQTPEKTFFFAKSDENINFSKCSWILEPIQNIAKKCLVKDYKERINASELYRYTKENYKLDTMDKIIPLSFVEKIEKIKDENLNNEFIKSKKEDDEIRNEREFNCVQTLNGHNDSVFCLKIFNEHTIASGSYDKTIKIWDLVNNTCLKTLNGHTDSVRSLQIINENTLASGSDDNTIRIWSVGNNKCDQILKGHTNSVLCIQCINEHTIASGSYDKTIKIWDLVNKKCLQTLNGHIDSVRCIHIINEQNLASGSDDNTIRIWSVGNNTFVQILEGHTNSVLCIEGINKHTIASGSYDKTIKIWDLVNNTCLKTLYGHTYSVRCLQLINEHTIASGSYDNTIKIWNLVNNNCEQTLYGHTYSVRCLQLINENTLVSGSVDNTIKIWK